MKELKAELKLTFECICGYCAGKWMLPTYPAASVACPYCGQVNETSDIELDFKGAQYTTEQCQRILGMSQGLQIILMGVLRAKKLKERLRSYTIKTSDPSAEVACNTYFQRLVDNAELLFDVFKTTGMADYSYLAQVCPTIAELVIDVENELDFEFSEKQLTQILAQFCQFCLAAPGDPGSVIY